MGQQQMSYMIVLLIFCTLTFFRFMQYVSIPNHTVHCIYIFQKMAVFDAVYLYFVPYLYTKFNIL